MKKIIILLLISCSFWLFGCDKKVEKFYLDDSSYSGGNLTEIKSDEYIEKADNKDSFAIYVYTPGCLSCAEFKEVLEEYIKETNMSFYMISTPEMKKTDISKYVTYGPSMVIVKEGKIIAYLDAVSDDDKPYYKTTDGLDEWLNKYILMKEE